MYNILIGFAHGFTLPFRAIAYLFGNKKALDFEKSMFSKIN